MTSSPAIIFLLLWTLHRHYVSGDCPPEKKTKDHLGRCCHFPFRIGLLTFHSCTTAGWSNKPWCSLDAIYWGRGALCDNPCVSGPCQNGGTCTITGYETYSCKCVGEYFGENCENKPPCPPGKKTEDPKGRCCHFPFRYHLRTYRSCTTSGLSKRPWCSFDFLYLGRWAYCVDECASNPCKNGATCQVTQADDGYTCEPCPSGWQGKNCDEEINECASDPCMNGGSCRDQLGSYVCDCPSGFTGTNCETDIDECESFPCMNGGSCRDQVASYVCDCPTGFTGANCETDINECASFPCMNGGSCRDQVGSYVCDCPSGFTGTNCETDINECASDPCMNGGSCRDQVGSYVCDCPSGFTGTNCETDINECASDPCINGGSCRDQVGSYVCDCPSGFTGTNCATDINECASDPCINGGSCRDQVGSYVCDCPSGFTGTNCETDINECLPENPCKHGGTCVNSPGSYRCQCAEGYAGKRCTHADWKAEGCYMESGQPSSMLLPNKYGEYENVDTSKPQIEAILNKCRAEAQKLRYRIFAIKNYSECVSTTDGKKTGVDFTKYGVSSECEEDSLGNGIGVGNEGSSIFVYTR